MDIPVLIVGGGPVGLALALELGWRGVECVLIEQTDGGIATPKMQEVNTRTMEFCRRWGMADEVMNCPFPEDLPMDVVVVTKLGAHELGRIERPARRLQRPGPHSPVNLQVCSQQWFDPMLRERAESFPGVRLLYRHRLDAFESDAGGVTVSITDLTNNTAKTMRARYLVGADGASSQVRRKLGIELEGSPALSHSMHLFFKAPDLFGQLGVKPGTFFPAIDKDGYWGNLRVIDPVNGLWRVLFDVPAQTMPQDIDREALLRRCFARPIEVEWVAASKWTRRGVVAERFSEGPVFLVGDAVHQVSPTGALGMNTGIADAVDLGWKLAATLAGWGGPRLLQSYDAERRPASTRNVRMATQFYEGQAQFQEQLDAIDDDGAAGAALRERIGAQMSAHIGAVFKTLGLQIGIRYENSPVCVADGTAAPPDDPQNYIATARPGARAPHVPLADGRSTLDLFGRGFVLMRLQGSDAQAGSVSAIEAAARARQLPLETVSVPEPRVREIYENNWVLVRPDGHVAWRGDVIPDDVGRLLDCVRGAAS